MSPGLRVVPSAAGGLLVVAGVAWLARATVDYQMARSVPLVIGTAVVGYASIALGYGLLLSRARTAVSAPQPTARSDEALTMPGSPAGSRADWLLLLRAVAAALVFSMHALGMLHHDVTWHGSAMAWIAYSPSSLGMLLFFSLSGYLMGKGFFVGRYTPDRAGVTRFFTSRFLRLAPLAFFVALLVVLLQAPQWLSHPDYFIRLVTFTLSSAEAPPTVVPLWSLSTEWHFYLLVPLIFLALRSAIRGTPSLVVTTVVVTVLGLLVRYWVWRTHGDSLAAYQYVYQPVYSNLEVFLLGFLTSWWRPLVKSKNALLARLWPAVLAALVVGYSWIAYHALQLQEVRYQAFFAVLLPTLVSAVLMVVLCGAEASAAIDWAPRDAARYRLTRRALYWLGALTFPVYVAHGAVLFGLEAGIPDQRLSLRLPLGVLLVLLVAAVLHLTVERSALRMRRDLLARGAVTAAATPRTTDARRDRPPAPEQPAPAPSPQSPAPPASGVRARR